jgi:hypothetical protein
MHDRIDTPKPLVGEPPPELKGLGRDLRIDVCRGIALWFVFLDHVPNNIGSWLTLRNYGFSDTAEVLGFISGVTCALAYGRVHRCEGWSAVVSRSLRRSWDIYAAFLLLTLACPIMVYLAGRAAIDARGIQDGRRFCLKTRCTTLVPMPSFRPILRMPWPSVLNPRRATGACANPWAHRRGTEAPRPLSSPPQPPSRSCCSIAFSRFLSARSKALASLGSILPLVISVRILH